jgi:hypothetical protein
LIGQFAQIIRRQNDPRLEKKGKHETMGGKSNFDQLTHPLGGFIEPREVDVTLEIGLCGNQAC